MPVIRAIFSWGIIVGMKAVALSIAGSDTSGGAGIQADIKTFAAMGVYGLSVAAVLTAQNSIEVKNIFPVPPAFVTEQISALFDDFNIGAVKTGMLYDAGIIGAVADSIKLRRVEILVVDPVIAASTGALLMVPEAVQSLKSKLFPLAHLVTPNTYEASIITGREVTDRESMKQAAMIIKDMGPKNVLIKGGHLAGEKIYDILFSGAGFRVIEKQRINTPHSHGTGCALSAAITACLAKGENLDDSVTHAERFMDKALAGAYGAGKGPGPVDHMAGFKSA